MTMVMKQHFTRCKGVAQLCNLSYGTGMALGMAMSITGPLDAWSAMKFCTDFHGPQRMKPTDVGDLLAFLLTPP